MFEKFNAIILAGGKSSRMGQNKALLKFGDKMLIEIILSQITSLVDTVIISANSNDFDFLGMPIVKDFHTDAGPLSGLYAGLSFSNSNRNLVLPCDVPFLDKKIIVSLISLSFEYENVWVSAYGKLHPLIGIYSKSLLPVIEDALLQRNLKIKRVLGDYFFTADFSDFDEMNFVNLNTTEDFLKALRYYEMFFRQ